MTKKIFIDPGHGGKDPGAVAGGFRESDLNLKVALAAESYLKDYDCLVFMSRRADTATKIADSTALAKKLAVDAYVSIHHNAGGGRGSEVFYWQNHAPSKALAAAVLKELTALGQRSRGLKESNLKAYNFGVCRINALNSIAAVLGEFAFLDNEQDRKAVDSNQKLKEQGAAYAKALISFLGLTKKADPKPDEIKPDAGKPLNLKGAALYISSDSPLPAGKLSGKYYLYDGLNIKGRYRITNSSANVGRLPVGRHVTGWVKKEDLAFG